MKTTLRSINSTLLTVLENEKFLSKSLEEMAKHVNAQDGEIREMFTAYSLLLPINEHAMQLNGAIDECRREYEILIDAVIDSQRGVIQPGLLHLRRFWSRLRIAKLICQVTFHYLFPRVLLTNTYY